MKNLKILCIATIVLLCINESLAQCVAPPNQAWNWAGPSVVSNSNRLFGNRNIIYDEFHNIYTVAQLESGSVTIGGFTVSAHYGVDNILIKQDQNGNVIWAKTFGSSLNDGENSVANMVCDQNGSIYIAYNCQDLHVNGVFASITNANAIHIIQFNYNGNYVADLFPAQGAGGISALEFYNSELYFSDGNTIKKRDALGVISTVVTLNNTSTIRIWNIKHAPNGDWIINGYFTSPLTYDGVTLNEYYTPSVQSAEFFFRLNSSNHVVYALRMDGLADFYSGTLGIAFDNQSNLLFGGIPQGPVSVNQWRFQNTTMTLDYSANSAIVIKIDAASGNMLWNRQFRSQFYYTGNMLFLLCNPNNEILVVGSYTNGGVLPYAVCLPDYQNFILKLKANGEKIYFQNFGLGGGSFQSRMAITTWDYCKYFITGKGGDLYTVNNPNYNCLTFPYTGMYFTASFNDYSFEIDGNGIDDDCDGQVDEDNPNYQRWFRDVDGDGFGNAINSTFGCSASAGYVSNSNDCDDNNPQIGYTHWYVDADGDGYGDANDPGIASCNSIAGKVSNNKDCIDNNNAIHPGATEVCNQVDDNCDGVVDAPASESGGKALAFNGNGDIVVINNSPAIQPGMEMTIECWARSNTSTWNNYGMMVNKDNSFIIHPDQGLKQVRFYVYTNTNTYAIAFSPSPTFDITQWHHYAGTYNGSLGKMYFYVDGELVAQGNNTGGSVNTNGNLYIGYDPCCGGRYLNGSIDEVRLWNIVRSHCEIKQAINVQLQGNETGLLAYYDFNNPSVTIGGNNTGLSTLNDIATGNGAQNGTLLNFTLTGSNSNWVTGKTATPLTWYADMDNDGFGNSSNSITSFTQPCNTSCIAGDCNDNNPAVYPGAVEVCNGIDDDCDGQVDKTLMNGLKLYMPFDGNANDVSGNNHNGIVYNATLTTDRFGTPNSAYHFNGTNARIEIPDHADLRPASLSISTWVKFNGSTGQQYQAFISKSISTGYFNSYVPAYDNISGQIGAFMCNAQSCASTFVSQPINAGWLHYVTTFDDATKVMKIYLNGGLVSTISATLSIFYDSSPLTLGCEYESGVTQYFANADLDDVILFNRALSNSEVSGLFTNGPFLPVSVEICNGVDDDCDGQIDEGFPQNTYYADADGDSYGDPAKTSITCATTPPSGYVTNNKDCDDNNASVHPGAIEVCNGIDDDCDGLIDEGVQTTFYRDQDGDGYGNLSVTIQACTAPSGYVSNSTDCNDGNAAIHPGAMEICNNIDDDCDGLIDEGVQSTFYRDQDGDSYGNLSVTIQACTVPSGYVSNSTDCNDGNSAIHPGAIEICNNIDDDCDGLIDELATGGTIPVITASGPLTFCVGGSVTLTSSNGNNYLWSSGAITQSITVSQSGTYSVTVTSVYGCSATSAVVTVVVNSLPAEFSLTSIAGQCTTGTPLSIGLPGSQIGVNYQLKLNGTINIGSPIPGTGLAISFGNQTTAGTYTVLSVNTSTNCTSSMIGNIIISSTGTLPALTATCTNNNPVLYFGFTLDQKATITVKPSGGMAPYKVSITMNRPINCNLINSSGDEIWAPGANTGSNSYTTCPVSGSPLWNPVSTSTSTITSATGYLLDVTLMQDAIITATVTDANRCTYTCTNNIHAEDVRCFAGNSNIVKVTICHKTGSIKNPCVKICVDQSAVQEHLAHGDFLGNCTPNCLPPTIARPSALEIPSGMLQVSVMPNPTPTSFNIIIKGKDAGPAILRVMDVYGRVIQLNQKLGAFSTLRIGDKWPGGAYFIEVSQGGERKILRVIKVK